MMSRGISSGGLQTFDQMKQRVKKALRITEKAFSVLTETSEEVKRRQTLLLELCESTEACLNMLSDKDYALLELGVKNLKNQLAADHKQSLEREEDVILVADRKIFSDLHSERICDVEKRLCSVEYELQEHFRKLADNAVRILSNHLQSCKVVEKFTSWTLDDIPDTGESWEVTDHFIQDAFRERLQNTIAAWEDENKILSRARTSMVQLSHQRFDESKSFLPFRYLENSSIADDDTGPNICLTSNDFGAAQKVMIGVASLIWVPVGLAVLVGGVPVVGAVNLTKKVTNMIDSRKYEKDKLGFIMQASREYLCNVAKEQHLWLFGDRACQHLLISS
ncbi:hypothetical protein AWC38_SpisGene1494 [Stylophora pistillata]|uniref:Uncharacterized protein n=1 Tax=Stylophora pistillata TaxID=50429 RepID=A0A2B4SXM7_STYPI|nr:hypothetical protein AWC38_SpisGene1494 [Stylophora pistillata]